MVAIHNERINKYVDFIMKANQIKNNRRTEVLKIVSTLSWLIEKGVDPDLIKIERSAPEIKEQQYASPFADEHDHNLHIARKGKY